MKKTKVWLCLFLVILSYSVKGQTSNTAARIIKFLQKNTDSSFVYERYNNWVHSGPRYLILIKKEDTLSAFVYDSNYKKDERIISLPRVFRDTLLRKNREMRIMTPIGVNHLFTPKYLGRDSLSLFWRSLDKLDLWGITDDAVDGIGCQVGKDKNNNTLESDQSGIRFYLITKTRIKTLEFYAPEQSEKVCPGRKGRVTALKGEKAFLDYLNE